MIEQRILVLRDGRKLSMAEFGDPRGKPLLYFHGFPGSGLEAELAQAAANKHGVRLVGLDRPGYGLSDPSPNRRLSDWPQDVIDVADALGIGRFAVAGSSGGGPYAVACAARIPERLTEVGLLCGLGPPESRRGDDGMMWHNRLGLTLAERAPWLARPVLGMLSPVMRHFGRLAIANLERHVTEPDRLTLRNPEVRRVISGAFREAFRRGSAGAISDARIYGRSWEIDLASIRVPVHIWHGKADAVVPLSMAQWVEAAIPSARAVYLDREGHFSLIVHHADTILAQLK